MTATSRAAAPAIVRLASADAAGAWLRAHGCTSLVADSRRVAPGSGFVAWPGAAHDGRRYVAQALADGAPACLVEADGLDAWSGAWSSPDARIGAVAGLKALSGPIASRFLDTPSARLDVVAVTGTNGKTSTTCWIAEALNALGRRTAVVGTLGVGVPTAGAAEHGLVATGLTTPDPVTLQAAFARLADEGVVACAIEASSIGLVEERLAGTAIRVAVFTNLTQDHLDFHGDMASYGAAKARLFAWPGLKAAVLNVDDAWGQAQAGASARTLGADAVWTCSRRAESGARLVAHDLRYGEGGLTFTIAEREGGSARVAAPVMGDYNVHNLLAVIGTLRALGVPLAAAARACAAVTPVPGRMQRVAPASADAAPDVVVDYAHTPDALEQALAALRPLASARGGALWCVFGCGGDRDPGKRPLMGAIARRGADRVIVTSDNPRSERADAILAQILAGVPGHDEVDVIENRAEAITQAVARAGPRDVVLVAGKGHETYQEIAGVRQPFSDAAVAAAALARRATLATLRELGALLPRARVVGEGDTPIRRVHSDTRTLRAGDLFVALRGERFDAHDFLAEARERGALAALAEGGLAEAGLAGLEVADSKRALGELAAGWRARHPLPLVAVTGSNGKTTVTQMVASIFRAWQGDASLATAGNFNNDIGVPLTLLRLRPLHTVAVLELGMNHPGEIARLAAMAAPSVALVNNAQREHLEFMHSVDAVARENGSVIAALPADGTAVLPADDAHTPTWRALAGRRRVLSFGADGDVQATGAWQGGAWQVTLATPAGTAATTLAIAGRHNVRNAAAAAAAALAAGAPLAAVAAGLAAFRPVKGRSHARSLLLDHMSRTLVDDTYNANPDSMRAAIDVLAELPGPRWLIAGDMGEVGDQGPALHREIGAYAAERGIDALWACGPQGVDTAAGYGAAARAYADVAGLLAALATRAARPPFASVLVKGSRFMQMERVVAALDGLAAGTVGGQG